MLFDAPQAGDLEMMSPSYCMETLVIDSEKLYFDILTHYIDDISTYFIRYLFVNWK